jgi:hypothetical protein
MNMRTKITFLAAAALAAGLASSMAQSNVYSVNIVGYINYPMAAGAQTLLENPLDNGTNDLISIDNGTIPNKSTVSIWNGTGFTGTAKSSGAWGNDLSIGPGVGFFVTPKTAATITFIGQAPITNNYALAAGAQVMIGALLPIAGNLNDPAGANALNVGAQLPNKSTLSTWNGTGYSGSAKTSGAWGSNLSIGVAQGFFVTPKAAVTWTQYLQ